MVKLIPSFMKVGMGEGGGGMGGGRDFKLRFKSFEVSTYFYFQK